MPTVRVRIAVVVDPSGKWNAVGYSKDGDLNNVLGDDDMDFAIEGLGDGSGESRFWITATLPVPEAATVEGEVSSLSG